MIVEGGSGNDVLNGSLGADTVFGYGGNDTITGGDGNDSLFGGPGDDRYVFSGFFARDVISDQTGADEIRFLADITPADVRLAGFNDDLYVYVDNYGARIQIVDHLITTNSLDRVVFANGTTLSLTGGLRMTGTSSSDFNIQGTAFGDTILPLVGSDDVYAGSGNDTVDGAAGFDDLFGELGNDTLIGGLDGDDLYGGGGNDTYLFSGLWGTDFIGDFEGLNVVRFVDKTQSELSFTNSSGNLIISVIGGTQSVTVDDFYFGGLDTNYQFVYGAGGGGGGPTEGNDTITGTEGADNISALGGNDTVIALGGNDALGGNIGNDTLFGGNGNDGLAGDSGNDQLFGDLGNDSMFGGSGNDILGGNEGNDLFNGGSGNDVLWGGNGNDVLDGLSGSDSLFGDAGIDSLIGGNGRDTMTAHAGADRFIFRAANETGVGVGNRDIITDFVKSQVDRIDLSGIDANTATGVDEAFAFRGTGAFTGNGAAQVRYVVSGGKTIIQGSIDNDTGVEFEIELSTIVSLVAGDLIL